MHRTSRLFTLLCLTATAALAADDLAEAKRHSDQGLTLYKGGQYKEAIAEFKQAISLSMAKKPEAAGVVNFNLGQAYEKDGQLAEAVQAYREYLRLVPNAKDKDAVTSVVANLEDRLNRKEQDFSVNTNPSGAAVSIDGTPKGVTPLATQLKLGDHEMMLSLEGYVSSKRSVTVTADSAVKLDIELAKKPPPQRVWTWVALGASAVATGLAVYFGNQATHTADQLKGSLHTNAQANQLYDDSVNQQVTSNVLYGTAGVAVIAAGALFFVEGSF